MRVVFLLLHFLARDQDVGAGGGDYVVAAVGGGVPDRFVLALQENGDAGGEAAEGGCRG